MIDVAITEFFKRILNEDAFLGDEGKLHIMDFNLDHVWDNTEASTELYCEFLVAYCESLDYDFSGLYTFELNEAGRKVVDEFWPHG